MDNFIALLRTAVQPVHKLNTLCIIFNNMEKKNYI